MKVFPVCLSLLFLVLPLSRGDATTIIEGHTKQLIADLTAYVDVNPEATDLDLAYAALAQAYTARGNKKKVLSLMEKRYHLNKDKLELDQLFGQFVSPIAMTYAEENMKRDGRRFLLEVRRDFRPHKQYAQIGQILNKLEKKFHDLLPGDTLDFGYLSMKSGNARLSQQRGNWVLVVFWSVRNVGGTFDLTELKNLYRDYASKGFEIIAINEDDRRTQLDKFLQQERLPWINVHDKHADNHIAETFRMTSTPRNILVDPEGKVAKLDLWGDGLRTYLALKVKSEDQ